MRCVNAHVHRRTDTQAPWRGQTQKDRHVGGCRYTGVQARGMTSTEMQTKLSTRTYEDSDINKQTLTQRVATGTDTLRIIEVIEVNV